MAGELLLDVAPELVLADPAVVERRADLFDQEVVDLLPELVEDRVAPPNGAVRVALDLLEPAIERHPEPSFVGIWGWGANCPGLEPAEPALWLSSSARPRPHWRRDPPDARKPCDTSERGESSTTGTPLLTVCGTTMSLGMSAWPAGPRVRSTSLTSSFTLEFARLSRRCSFDSGTDSSRKRLQPQLDVLDVGDVHPRHQDDVVGVLDERQDDVVELGRRVDHDVGAEAPEHLDDPGHVVAGDPLGERGLDRRRQHVEAARLVAGQEALEQLGVEPVHRRDGVHDRVAGGEAQEHGHVPELEVGVDDDDRPRPSAWPAGRPGWWPRRSCRSRPSSS